MNLEQPKHTDTNLSKNFQLNRISAHHVVLSPGCRSSYPHAESLEEEFVYVLSGSVHAWINGYIFEMHPGWAIGFPAGTGIAHSFINNSSEAVELLVAGESTKKENLCSFPLNPELQATSEIYSKIWWADYPPQNFGPHKGLPGTFGPECWMTAPPPFAVDVKALPKGKGFHYPGDNETFGEGTRLSDLIGLKALGIWIERLPAGRRSAYPHAHTHEEEFAYILDCDASADPEQALKVWENGRVSPLKNGDSVGFAPGTGVSHCLINDSTQVATYLAIGESCEFPDEKIIYPHHPLRNHECLRKKWLWVDPPAGPMGSHKGTPKLPIPEHLTLKLCSTDDAPKVLEIFETSPKYFLKVEGCPPSLESARNAIVDEPNKKDPSFFKEFLIIRYNQSPIGVAELHANHPEAGFTYIGLLLIGEKLFGKGLGRKSYELVEDYAKRAYGTKTLRLGVNEDHNQSGFWSKMGFLPNGNSYEWQGEAKVTTVHEYDKSI